MKSSEQDNPRLVGVLNVTQDSFSDGGLFFERESAIARAHQLLAEGAYCIDVGGDSSRPGSACVGIEEEWRRIAPVIDAFAAKVTVSVDTHHYEVARRAVDKGARWINDISAGRDSGMFDLVADSGALIVLTYTRCSQPHVFDGECSGDIIGRIKNFLSARADEAIRHKIKESQIILDPGMGAFLGDSAELSFEVLRRFDELSTLGFPLMLSASRKGFLRSSGEKQTKDRDAVSAMTASYVMLRSRFKYPEFIRVHNVSLHKDMLAAVRRCEGMP